MWHPSDFGKIKKMVSNSLANQLGKNRNLTKLISPRGNIRVSIPVPRGRVKKEIKNRE
jgi:hypothetical protein